MDEIETKKTIIQANPTAETVTIDEKAESKGFFTKRNIIILIITTLLSIALVALTIRFIININWNQFFVSLGGGLKLSLGGLWFFLLLVFMVYTIAYNVLPIWIRLKRLNIKVPFVQYLLFSLAMSFIKAVTPSNFIYDPYTVFWLKTQGVSTSKATSIIFSNGLLWQAMELIIHIPSYIIVMMNYDKLIQVSEGEGIALIFLMSVGLFIDIIGTASMFLLCFSKKMHYLLSVCFNWFKKALRMKYHTKPQIREKYKNRAVLKQDVIGYFKDWKATCVLVFILLSYELCLYFILSPSLLLVNGADIFTFSTVNVYHAANMAFNANRINLIPGLAAGLEWSLLRMLQALGGISGGQPEDQKEFISQGIFLWRSFYTYLPCLLGLVGFGVLTGFQIKDYKKKKSDFVTAKYE